VKVSKSTPKHEIWLAYAEDDLIVAKATLSIPDASIISVLFHSQQCAEKALKAYLVYHKVIFKRTHDLVALVKICAKINYEFVDLTDLAYELTPYATEVRYPESFYPELYEPIAEDAIAHATEILQFCKSAINTIVLTKKPQKTFISER
jgi:HEPN domain-containing protein